MNNKIPRRTYGIFAFIFAAFVVGCSLPAVTPTSPPPGGVTPDTAYTAAVETVVAELTLGAPGAAETGPPAVTATAPAPTPEPTAAGVPEPSPTPQPSPADTQAATSTASLADPQTRLGNPAFTEPFDNDDNWAFTDDEHTGMEVSDGRLEMVAFNADFWESWTITWVNRSDFYVEMTAAPQNCSGLDRYGVFFRAENDASEGYLYGFTCDGKYSLRIWDEEEFIELVDWTASPHIDAGPGNTNRLGVLANGNTIGLYANGSLLQEVEDNTYGEGHIGVFIGSANTEDFTVYVDQLYLWDLE